MTLQSSLYCSEQSVLRLRKVTSGMSEPAKIHTSSQVWEWQKKKRKRQHSSSSKIYHAILFLLVMVFITRIMALNKLTDVLKASVTQSTILYRRTEYSSHLQQAFSNIPCTYSCWCNCVHGILKMCLYVVSDQSQAERSNSIAVAGAVMGAVLALFLIAVFIIVILTARKAPPPAFTDKV